MPIFEYVCRDCHHRFEAIVRSSSRSACPSCKSENLDQQLSVFAVGRRSSRLAASEPTGPCGTCGDPRGPGSCFSN